MPSTFDVLPNLITGATASFEKVATVPATSASEPLARVQQMAAVPGTESSFAVLDDRGVVWLWDGEVFGEEPLIDLRDSETGFIMPGPESGLRSVAFHPDFATPGADGEGKLYLAYSAEIAEATGRTRLFAFDDEPSGRDIAPVMHEVVAEFTVNDLTAPIDPDSGRELMRIEQPFTNHNFGSLEFNPDAAPGDAAYGLLYLTLGDGGGSGDPLGAASRLDEILGKVLRIDPLAKGHQPYTIPDDNPFVPTEGALDEIYAFGFRNPQNLSFGNGHIFVGEIGQASVEEINVILPGEDYGWNAREGTFSFSGGQVDDLPAGPDIFQYPLTQYDHESSGLGRAATAGGLLYQGDDVPALAGSYVFADLTSGAMFFVPLDRLDAALADGRIDPSETRAPERIQFVDEDGSKTSFLDVAGSPSRGDRVDLRLEVDPSGEIFAFSKTNGDIFRLVSAPETVGVNKIKGTPEADDLFGSGVSDVMKGRRGADIIEGRGGADTLIGGRGRDDMQGNGGNDLLRGGRGDDTLMGSAGADDLRGGAGVDVMILGGLQDSWTFVGDEDLFTATRAGPVNRAQNIEFIYFLDEDRMVATEDLMFMDM